VIKHSTVNKHYCASLALAQLLAPQLKQGETEYLVEITVIFGCKNTLFVLIQFILRY